MSNRVKHQSIVYQAQERLKGMECFGTKKHPMKQEFHKMAEFREATRGMIFSGQTLKTYIKNSVSFLVYERDVKGRRFKTIDEYRPFVAEYLNEKISKGDSASSIKTYAAAIAKLYGCSYNAFGVELPMRKRSMITRSRNSVEADRHYSESKNADLINFCKGCGLRRSEVKKAAPSDIQVTSEGVFIQVKRGKGGKDRKAYVLPEYAPLFITLSKLKEEKIFSKVSSAIDIHSFRREYAQAYYKSLARPLEEIPVKARYHCRTDCTGTIYDSDAMRAVSLSLGHGRLNVISQNYLT